MESAPDSECGVRIQLAREDHRVFWPTQGKLEGHTRGIRRGLKRCVTCSIWEGGENSQDREGISFRLIP